MTQPTYMDVDGEDNGPVFVGRLNDIINGLVSSFAGATAPTEPESNMVWQDTSTNPPIFRRRNSNNTAWDTMGSWSNSVYSGSCAGSSGSTVKWNTPRALSLSGDVTGSMSVDGSANANAAVTLANSGAAAGAYGSATSTLTVTVNSKGLITSIASTPITFPVTVNSFNGRTGAVSFTASDMFDVLPDKTGNGGKPLTLNAAGTALEWKYAILTPVIEHREFGTNALITPPFSDYELGGDWWAYRPSCDNMVLHYVNGTPQILYTKYYVFKEFV